MFSQVTFSDISVQNAIRRGAWIEHAVNGVTMGPKAKERQKLVSNLKVGQEILLEREPDNQYDSNAIKVLVGKKQAGFVSAKPDDFFGIKGGLASWLSKRIDAGEIWRVFVSAVVGGEGEKESFGCRVVFVMVKGESFSFDSHYPLGEKKQDSNLWPEESEASRLISQLYSLWPHLSSEEQERVQSWAKQVKKFGGAPDSYRGEMRDLIQSKSFKLNNRI